MKDSIEGKAYVLGDHVDTDQIIPARHLVYNLNDKMERMHYGELALSGVPPEGRGLPGGNIPFIEGGLPSSFSIIVAGKNFGCGSSREHAPVALQMAGIRAVVALSYARIFYRNVVDGGFLIPLESGENLSAEIRTNDLIRIDLNKNELINATQDKKYGLKPPGEVDHIVRCGGLFGYARAHGMLK